MSPDVIEDIIRRYLEAFNNRDYDALISLYSQEATLEDPYGSPPIRGAAQIRAFYEQFKDGNSTLHLDGAIRAAERAAAFPFKVRMGNEANQVIEVIDSFVFDEAGKIKEMRAFWGAKNVHSGGQ